MGRTVGKNKLNANWPLEGCRARKTRCARAPFADHALHARAGEVPVRVFDYCSAFRNFFPKLRLILINRFLVRLSSNFQERLFMLSSSPEFLLWWGFFKITVEFRFFSPFPKEMFHVQLVFHKLCLIITHLFLARFSSNFQEKLLVPSS